MQKIFRLDPHVVDLIAAGEVVERPASVIKELMENAIDAGASMLTVEIRGGGLALMRVTDNGCGMSAEDAQTAFLRHATSKLRDARGLEAIGTLGFRGEALAAISSVARVELLTREKGADAGTRLVLEGGVVMKKEDAGCPDGTTILVRDLFFNTPARLKFMKTDRAEGAAVTAAVLRCALSRPDLSIRYIREGSEELHTPGDGKLDSCIYSLLGRDFSAGMLKTASETDGIRVTGFVSPPSSVHGNRNHQYFFVNGRCIRSKTLQAALEQAYRNRLPVGRFPACVLFLTMSPAAVDVNVHPAKTEVRFLNERQAFDSVYYAALGALEGEQRPAELHLSPSTEKALHPSVNAFTPPAAPRRAQAPADTFRPAEVRPAPDFYKKMTAAEYTSALSSRPAPEKRAGTAVFRSTAYQPYQTAISMPDKPVAPETPEVPEAASAPYRVIGEALQTYIFVEQEDRLILIDKHAAHERMLFDKLRAARGQVMSQMLLTPVVCSVGDDNAALLTDNADALTDWGITAEDFGNGTVLVRQAPADVDTGDIPALMEEICSALAHGGSVQQRSELVLHTVACKAAIKAGRSSDTRELMAVAESVMSGRVRYCPHGRPVSVELTKDTLDKNFKRI